MRRSLALLLATALLVTAGCTAGPETTTETPSSTPTPSEPTSATPATPATSVNASTVPGVAADGSVNSTALLRAHWKAVADSGAVVASNYTLDENRTFNRKATIGPEFDRVHVTGRRTVNGSRVAMARWVNTSGFIAKTEGANRTEYRADRGDLERRFRRGIAEDRRITEFLDRSTFSVQRVSTDNGTAHVTLVSTDFGGEPAYENVSVRLRVTTNGVIEALSVTGQFGTADAFAYTYETVRLGAQPVAVPDWVRDAPTPVDARLNFEFRNCSQTYLELRHEGGDALPAGSTVAVTTNGSTYEARTDRVPANESRYLVLTQEGLRSSSTAPTPAEIRDIGNEVELRVVTDEGLVLTNAGMAFSCEHERESSEPTGFDTGSSP